MQKNEIWEILGIAPTDDVELIKEAYRSKLLNTNPEDDQEGFMRLKEAFDEAVRSVNEGEEEEQEQPYAEIIEKVDVDVSQMNLSNAILPKDLAKLLWQNGAEVPKPVLCEQT